ncbi:hypothetical protein [Corynebacterium mastitidis]
MLPGADTLSREVHDVIPRWARGLVTRHRRTAVGTPRAAATVPLTGRCEPWMVELLESPERCAGLIEDHGSPVNIHHPAPVLRNIEELICAGRDCGVDVRVFLARKANKTLRIIDAVRDAGHGVDVASERELTQVLGRGVPGDRIILSAAIKPNALLERAVRAGMAVSADSPEEADRLAAITAELDHSARVAPRLAPDPAVLPPTRFGARAARWRAWLDAHPAGPQAPEVVAVHVHMHGYRAEDRRLALGEALGLIDHARAAGHAPSFIDLGGGVPMSYLDDPAQWEAFLRARAALPQAHRRGVLHLEERPPDHRLSLPPKPHPRAVAARGAHRPGGGPRGGGPRRRRPRQPGPAAAPGAGAQRAGRGGAHSRPRELSQGAQRRHPAGGAGHEPHPVPHHGG